MQLECRDYEARADVSKLDGHVVSRLYISPSFTIMPRSLAGLQETADSTYV